MASRFRSFLHLLLPCVLAVVTLAAEAGRPRAPLLENAAAPGIPPGAAAAPDEFLSGQNQARAAVGVDPLRWSAGLASEAARVVRRQEEAQKRCGFADLSSSRWGANQAWASYPLKAAEAVRSWVAEGKYYSYGNNSCAAGHECGTYTQVVWRTTAEVGCAQATCAAAGAAAGAGAREGGTSLTVCLYDPAGNIEGQKPY